MIRFLSSLVLIVSLSLNALAQQQQQNKIPAVLRNPFATTIAAVLTTADEDKFTREEVTIFPGRKNTFLMENLGRFKFTYRLQKNLRAPLIFVLPGTGGNAESGGALFLAEKMYKLGYHTVTLDNPFSWGFAVAASRTGLPGFTPRDSEDLYLAMQKALRSLQVQTNIRPRSYSLTGYSLGALQSLFLQRIDDQNAKKFAFQKILLVNPPADLLYAVSSLDRLYDVGDKLTPQHKQAIYFRIFSLANKVGSLDALKGASSLQAIFDELRLNNSDMSYLIGTSFRDSVRDIIFASQQVNDLGILKNRASRYLQNDRYDEAARYSFTEYITTFLLPQLQATRGAEYTIEDMNEEASIYQFGDYIKAHQNIFLVHTVDDLIIQGDKDVAWFMETFGPRATIFPYGGHCGEMNSPQFIQVLKSIFLDL